MDNEAPIISVVIPCYNVEKYVRDCLESVLAQTYKNIQVLVVDDGSTDLTAQIIREYTDPRIQYFYKTNGGLSDARNFGMDRAKGEYLCFLDSDDVYHPQFVSFIYQALTQTGASIARTTIQRFTDNLPVPSSVNMPLPVCITQAEAIFQLYDAKTIVDATVACTKLYARKLYENFRFPVGKLHEDVAVALEVLLLTQKVAVVEVPLYYYRYNAASIMNTIRWEREDGVEFYEQHYFTLTNLHNECARWAVLAAAKTALQCLCSFRLDSDKRKDPRYFALVKRLKTLAWKSTPRYYGAKDFLTMWMARLVPNMTVLIYGWLLKKLK